MPLQLSTLSHHWVVAFEDHGEPNLPNVLEFVTDPAPETQPAQHQGQRCNLQQDTDALPNAITVSLSELSSADGIHRANLAVGTSRSAMQQQQQPGALEVLHSWDAVQPMFGVLPPLLEGATKSE